MERRFRITVDGRQYDVTVDDLSEGGSLLYPQPGSMTVQGPATVPRAAAPASATAQTAAGPGDVLSTMGGVVDSVCVAAGQMVSEGDEILIVQAMKMNMPVLAPRSGKVVSVAVKPGDAIELGQVLATIA